MSEINRVIAAVKSMDELQSALKTKVSTVFFLSPDIMNIEPAAKMAHTAGKKLFIHIDLASGLGRDKSGIQFAARAGVDGIISTRANMIRIAKECNLLTVQRFFIVDSQSVGTIAENLRSSKTDFIEVLPGVVPKIIKRLKTVIDVPIIAGGLIDSQDEINMAVAGGAEAVSTGCSMLW